MIPFFERFGWLNCLWYPPGELWICKNMIKLGMESQKPEDEDSPGFEYQLKEMNKLDKQD